jgi:hypothetical protein
VRVAVLDSFGRWVGSAERELVGCGEDSEKWVKKWPGLKWDVSEVEWTGHEAVEGAEVRGRYTQDADQDDGQGPNEVS